MALVARSTTIDVDAVSRTKVAQTPNLPGLTAGEALLAGAPCYIQNAGTVMMSNGTAADKAATIVGWTGKAYAVGEPVTLYGAGMVISYHDDFSGASINPGDRLYLATTKGRLDTAATTGGVRPAAVVLDNTHIITAVGFGSD